MLFDSYQKWAITKARKDASFRDKLSEFSLGMSGEAGEVADYVKKVLYHGHSLDPEKLAREVGDVIWYAANLAYIIEYLFSSVAEMNIEKINNRYPKGFSEERSINREE